MWKGSSFWDACPTVPLSDSTLQIAKEEALQPRSPPTETRVGRPQPHRRFEFALGLDTSSTTGLVYHRRDRGVCRPITTPPIITHPSHPSHTHHTPPPPHTSRGSTTGTSSPVCPSPSSPHRTPQWGLDHYFRPLLLLSHVSTSTTLLPAFGPCKGISCLVPSPLLPHTHQTTCIESQSQNP